MYSAQKEKNSCKKNQQTWSTYFLKTSQLKKINGGLGVAVVSTPKGIMSGEEAKKQNLGGELICEVYLIFTHMSRIGKLPIAIPTGVTVEKREGNLITV